MADILGIGSSGLTAYRKLLETVGSNIVNANTEGYVRRDVSLQATGESTMLPTARATTSGSGVLIDSVRRGTDAFLQAQTYNSNALAKQAATLADSLSSLEKAVFTNSANVSTEVQNFYSSFSQVATAPTSAATRLTLLDAGERVATTFRSTAGQIQSNLQSVESAIDAALKQVNVLTNQLARLNNEIARSASGSQKPNDLLDQRDKLLQNLSNLVGFTMVESPTGAVDLYLGDTASGQKLIGVEGAHQLGVVKNGSRLDIAFDPNTSPSITTQIKTGTVAGLMDFRREANVLMQNVDRLAVGFINAVNTQHMLGVDQDGHAGKELFSADSLKAVAGTGNTGLTKMNVAVSAAAQITGATYTARYDSGDARWTVTSSDGRTASGATSVNLDGIQFSFEGTYSAKDVFTAEPLKNAASGMRFLRKTPSEIAAALPLYVDQGTGNQGSGVVAVTNRDAAIPPAPLPNAADIFAGTSLAGVDFLRNGPAFVIQAGTGPSSLTSLGTIPALRFTQPAGELLAINNADANGAGGMSLAFTLTAQGGNSISPQLDLFPHGSTIGDLARAINEAAASAGASDEIFASVSGGALNISAIGTYSISNGYLKGFDQTGSAKSIAADTEQTASASDMRLFTRDGRQLTGPPFANESEAAAFITTANGFLSEAFYRPPSVNSGYRGLNLSTASDLLSLTLASKHAATIDVAQSLYNQVPSATGQGLSAGAIYAMDVSGLPPIRLAGDAIGARDAGGIADALSSQMNSFATRRSWLGTSIKITPDSPPLHFTVTVDGADHQVTFIPGKKPENAKPGETYENTGTFEVAGPTDLQLSLVPDAQDRTKVRVMIAAPQILRTDAANISISADAATAAKLGLTATPAETRLTGAGDLAASLFAGNVVDLSVTVGTSAKVIHIHIDSVQGRQDGVSWAMVNGKLQLTAGSAIHILADQYSAKLGFDGTEPAGTSMIATNPLADEWLQRAPVTIQVAGLGSQTSVTINGTSGTDGDVSWEMIGGRLSLHAASTELKIVSNTIADRSAAARLGFLGTDLDLKRSSQITGSTELIPTLLSTRKPTLHLSGTTIGDKTITIDSVAGQVGGISWSIKDGKLTLSSSDPTLRVLAQDTDQNLAAMLGFTGSEQADQYGTLKATTDITSAMLATQPVSVALADGSRLSINSASGTASNGTWSVVNGRLRISSPFLAATVSAPSAQATARTLGFLGPDRDTSINGSVTAAASLEGALLANRAPQLHVFGTTVRDKTITISGPSGTAYGVSWNTVNGRLQLRSSDPTLRIVTQGTDKNLADALGFGGDETFDGSGALVAPRPLAESMLAASPETLILADGNKVTISAPNGTSGATSWSVVDGHLKITDPSLQPGLQRILATDDAAATSLGFNGPGQDALSIGSQIILTSSASDDGNDVVDTRNSRSVATNRLDIGSVVPEDLIVQLNNTDQNGLRRIAATLGERDTTKIPFPSITVKITSSNTLEIIDRKSGVSLANRTWMPDKDITYLGVSFHISGNALAGDVFDITNDNTRSGDSRNAQAITRMSTASIFGENQGSFADVYTSVASILGSSVNSAEMTATSAKTSASDLKSAYEAKTGVNLDTEASDLIRFQQAYQAAAQVVASARQMFETILRSF